MFATLQLLKLYQKSQKPAWNAITVYCKLLQTIFGMVLSAIGICSTGWKKLTFTTSVHNVKIERNHLEV